MNCRNQARLDEIGPRVFSETSTNLTTITEYRLVNK